jgi:hypothetical protein
MAQLYTNDVDFTKVFPMKTKSEAPDTLVAFMQDVGIPSALHSDDAKELTQGRMGEIMARPGLNLHKVNPIHHGKCVPNCVIESSKRPFVTPSTEPMPLVDCGIIVQPTILKLGTSQPILTTTYRGELHMNWLQATPLISQSILILLGMTMFGTLTKKLPSLRTAES